MDSSGDSETSCLSQAANAAHFMSFSSHNILPLADFRQSGAEIDCVRLLFRLFAPLHPVTVACRIVCTSRFILLLKNVFSFILYCTCAQIKHSCRLWEIVFFSTSYCFIRRFALWSLVHSPTHICFLPSTAPACTSSFSDYLTKYMIKRSWP